MKKIPMITIFCLSLIVGFSQSVPAPTPIEQHYGFNYWWWVLGVLVAIGIGVGIYMVIKKDPRKDASR